MQYEYIIPIVSYLLGSIPFGFLLVKLSGGQDIRSFGSGNIGATNVFRKSRITGILTLILDAGKGYLAVAIAVISGADPAWQAIVDAQLDCILAAGFDGVYLDCVDVYERFEN